jgi:predicted dehydrogenase
MERMPMAIIGCGGMGRRHLTGLAELYRSSFCNVELVAVCDVNRQNAEDLADEAVQQLGRRPGVFAEVQDMVRTVPELQGADVVTDAGTHHVVASACLEAGLHVLCEKPLALTMRGCNRIVETARRTGRILSVAENYRRDPLNRLACALIQDGAIGTPQLLLEITIGGGNRLMITPWRHHKASGTVILDIGVHLADILQYYLGDAVSAYGEAQLYERYRYKTDDGGPGGFYAKWAAQMPDVVMATGEDALFGYVHFASGAIGQAIFHFAGHGRPAQVRQVYGSKGSLVCPGDRNGRPITLCFDGGQEVSGEEILGYAPSYRLSPVAAELFGGERIWTYDFPFAVTDAKILALEYDELGACMQTNAPPEVSGEVGRRATALVYAIVEAGRLGRPVTLAEVERVEVDGYQRAIDEHLGLS